MEIKNKYIDNGKTGTFIDIDNQQLVINYWWEPSRWNEHMGDEQLEYRIDLYRYIDITDDNYWLIDNMISNGELDYSDYYSFDRLGEFIEAIKTKIKERDNNE